MDVFKLLGRVGLEGGEQTVRGLQRVSGQADRTGRSLTGVGRTGSSVASGLGKVAAVGTGAVVGGLLASAKAAIDWEDAFTGVRKTVDASEAGFKQLEGDLRGLATELPISAVRLAQLGETAGALGVGSGTSNPLGAVKEFVRVTALLGETTDLSADAAATSMGHLSTVLQLTDKDYERFASTLVDLGNKGASTESQILGIAERAGAGAKLIGIAKAETLGWSSAVANLGIEVEAGGSSLQTFFTKTVGIVAEGGPKLKTFAKVAGVSVGDFKRLFEKDASGALETFLGGLGKLDKEQQVLTLKALGFSDIRITRMLLGLAGNTGNLTTSLDQAGEAWQKNTALSAEAEKRFGTVRSQIGILKNNFVEAGISIGEGMLPSIKRWTQQGIGFLKANQGELKTFGAEIGEMLEGIDFGEALDAGKDFVGVLKDALGVVGQVAGVVNGLPDGVKAAGAALLVLNKASGGMVGDVVGSAVGGLGGGLLRGAAAKVPGLGALVAVPVVVTNWPMGGLGGPGVGGAAAGGAGGMLRGLIGGLARTGAVAGGGLLLANANAGTGGNAGTIGNTAGGALAGAGIAGPIGAFAGALAGLVKSTHEVQSAGTASMATSIRTGLDSSVAGKSMGELKVALGAVEQGIAQLESTPLATILHGDAYEQLKASRNLLQRQIATTSESALAAQRASERASATTATGLASLQAAAALNVARLESASARSTSVISGTTRSESAGIRRAAAANVAATNRAREAAFRTRDAVRASTSSITSRIGASIGVERAILAKKRDISITVSPRPTYLSLDGRRVAAAMTRYGPAITRHQ